MRRLVYAFLIFNFQFLIAPAAHANWEYSGGYDDGGRLTLSFRGGIAAPFASMKNKIGVVDAYYCPDGSQWTGESGSCTDADIVKKVELGKLPVANDYDGFAFAGGASVGMVLGGSPKVRLELDWLHITETNYDATPLFSEIMEMPIGGGWYTTEYPVGSASSTVQTDIVSAMFYYDFFDGSVKRAGEVIPYVGFGLGYATSTTILSLSDAYGDFAGTFFDKFIEASTGSPIDWYYTSQTQTNNFALSGALGFAYGLDTGVFFDMGARASYVPRIRWAINDGASTSTATSKEKDVFSAENIIFLTVYAGLRFEF